MKAIVITDERIDYILPQNIKESDVISENAKKVLATIMNYYLVLDKVKQQGYVHLSNQLLRQSVKIKQNDMMTAIQELIDYDLIEREVGKIWTEGQPHMASKYTVKWNNLQKPLKKKTFEELFQDFLKPSETPMGTIVLDSVSVLGTVLDSEKVLVKDEVKEKVLEEEKVPDEETLSEYLARIKRKKERSVC